MSTQTNHTVAREDLGDAKVKLHVEVPKDVVQSAAKSVKKQIMKHIKIPGFRRDKTPLPLVKQYVGQDRFNEYVQRELLPKVYYEALEQEKISPISEVSYENIQVKKDEFAFDANFSVAPDFKLGDYKSLKLKPVEPEAVEDSAIDEFLSEMAERSAEMQDAAKDAVTEEGHHVSALVKGKIDGEDVKALRHYNVGLTLGKEQLYPDFDKNLVGKKKLDRVTFEYSFDKDFENKALAGKTAEIEVKILGHKLVEVPAIDDAFAAKVGGFDDVQTLKDQVRVELERRKKEEATTAFRKEIQDALHGVIECEIPQSLVEELTEAKLHDLKHDLQQQGKTLEDHLEGLGKSEEEYKEELNQDSSRELKLSFGLTEIARKEELKVEDLEILQRIDMTARALQKRFDEILEYVESLGRRVLIRSEIMQEKALGYLENLYSPEEESADSSEEASA